METNENQIVDENAQVDPFEEVSNKSVRQTLNHQIKRPIASYIKQFVDNKLINPDNAKDVEDVIRVYWGLQDVSEMSAYHINPMQQRIGEIFSKNPGLIKKLHYCRSFFTQQQLRYTKAVQAIQKISKYSMFTTEYDSDTIVPVLGEKMAWGQTSGIADKQICVLVASADASWIKTIASPDDVKLINYLQKMFGTVSMADNLTLITSKMPMSMNKSQLFNEKTYSARISVAKPDRTNEKVPSTEKYDVIYGDPFSIMDTIARSKVMDNNPYRYRGNKQQKNQPNNDDSIHTGIVSKYGLIECHSFSTDYYRDVMDEYVKSSKLREDNVQLYEHIWARFNVQYEQLLTSMVDRAIMVAHQTMVDFLISVYEQKFSIPQLMMFYSPGTMIKIKTDYEVNQCAMVLNSYVDNSNGESSLTLSVLNPNTTKEQHIMIHDTNIGTMAKSKPGYGISIINGGTRSGSIFNYYTTSASVDLMLDTDIDKQLAFSKMCIKMAITPQHMEIDGNYYWSEHVYGPETDTKQTPYKGRVMVDYVHTRSGFSDFDKNVIISKHDLNDVYELATVDYFKNKTVYPGGIDNEGSSNILLTGDKFLSDIRLMLSLPVMASAMILKDKRWGLVKVLDLKDVEYHPEAYDQIVMDNTIKETIKVVTENQDKNTFRDIIGGKESGCIYLLAGDPGVGKTLLAESIAEKLQKPLYQVSAGELGSWDGKIESSLKRILDQAQRWKAIVLMDEADTFLYKRTDGSIERNAVVSTFLRQLEYFNGTLFLTSNRSDDIDPAFMSRILQCIKFVSLTEDERATVWKGLVAKQGVTLTDEQASILAKFNVNGRQIKNVIKVAIALSLGAKKDLSFDTINDTAASMHSGKTLTNKGFEK